MTLDPLDKFFKVLHSENGQWVDESNSNGLRQKKFCSGQMGHFGPENGASSELWIGSNNFF